MIFSTPIFLFFFLPLVLTSFLVLGKKSRKGVLIVASLIFYCWGEKTFFLIIASAVLNFGFALSIDHLHKRSSSSPKIKWVLAAAVLFNLGLLGFFKYTPFIVDNINALGRLLGLSLVLSAATMPLPLGISFYTFRALSYVIDVYKRKVPSTENILDMTLYLSFFPLAVAGPIVRYGEMPFSVLGKGLKTEKITEGIRRFIFGLGKKCLIANTLAVTADWAFSLPPGKITAPAAWMGLFCYTLQIYFDFSGYSDMAIGLGKIFGFDFLENFNYPYAARSIRDFWRRWHISLSTWFRDYLYIPLGGNQVRPYRVYGNLLLVFFLCGLWHGAAWKFIVWGLWHGLFLALERTGFGRLIEGLWRPLRHFYALMVVALGWVWFRSDTLSYALSFIKSLFGLSQALEELFPPLSMVMNPKVVLALLFGVLFSAPSVPILKTLKENLLTKYAEAHRRVVDQVNGLGSALIQTLILLASAMSLAGQTYFPFIYLKF
ncbi:MAG TPA: MBOAT family O-acyltransferase [Thermodesulfobacteriota bacterium]|nr:MBOAT family O-acyltransferase [Thermodesulfobacteriota bacterium]